MKFRWYPVMHRRGSGLTLIELLAAIAALGLVGVLFLAALQTPKTDRQAPPSWKTSRKGTPRSQLVLRVVSMTNPVRLDQKKAIRAVILNQGDAPATLVLPDDGSYEAWRAPVVAWSVLPSDDSTAAHIEPPTQPQGRKCGNLDPLTRDQVFTLQPGETRVVEAAPDLPGLGRYRIIYYYRNDPKMRWLGAYQSDPEVMQRVRDSTPCSLVSNELVITAVE